MADEGRVHTAVTVELFFKRKNHQRFGDVIAQQANASLSPRPKLGGNVIGHGNSALVHFAGDAPIESGRVDDDGEVGFAAVSFGDELVKQSPDFREVSEDFGDADDGEVGAVNDGVASRGAHARAADSEKFESC